MIKQKFFIIYTLQLEKNKYYVGKTTNLEKRLKEHFNGFGSEWTKFVFYFILFIQKFQNY